MSSTSRNLIFTKNNNNYVNTVENTVDEFIEYNPNYTDTIIGTRDVTFDTNTHIFNITGKLTANQIRNNSDIRLKKDVVEIENALDVLLRMVGKQYKLKSTNETHYGFIAQEMKQIIPDIVGSENGMLNISYIELIPFIIESIKQLDQKINNINDKMDSIGQQLSSMMRKFE